MLPIPPSALILSAMEKKGFTTESFCAAARMPPKLFKAVTTNRRKIKLGTAMRLGRMLGTSPWVWIAFQQRYDKAL